MPIDERFAGSRVVLGSTKRPGRCTVRDTIRHGVGALAGVHRHVDRCDIGRDIGRDNSRVAS